MLPGKILYVLIICFTFLLTSENSNPKKILQKNKMSLNTVLNDLSSESLTKEIISSTSFYY